MGYNEWRLRRQVRCNLAILFCFFFVAYETFFFGYTYGIYTRSLGDTVEKHEEGILAKRLTSHTKAAAASLFFFEQ
jgi:hypothetical protein